jgi:hypothetical protein
VIDNPAFGKDDISILVDDKYSNLDLTMHFDYIIGNPPYDGQLHLKILEKVSKLSDNIQWLAPIRWLQDPMGEYKHGSAIKKYREIAERIENLEIINQKDAGDMFGDPRLFCQPLGIYTFNKDHSYYYKKMAYLRDNGDFSALKCVFDKIIEKNQFSKMNVRKYNDKLQNFVLLSKMCRIGLQNRGKSSIKQWYGYFQNGHNQNGLTYPQAKYNNAHVVNGDISHDDCLVFDTPIESKNCFEFHKNSKLSNLITSVLIIDIQVYNQYLLWLPDYTHVWTDEDVMNWLGLTEDEKKELRCLI